MTDTPQFLEFHISCADIVESLAWYRNIGFTELMTSDIRAHHYAVITDGLFCIGLHEDKRSVRGLTFVRQQLAKHVRRQQIAGVPFDYAQLSDDEFNEAAQTDPDGTLAIQIEARTFSGTAETTNIPVIGGLSHISLPCLRLAESLEFWQQLGFIAVESGLEGQAELHMPGLIVHLDEGTRLPEFHFLPLNFAHSCRAVENSNTPFTESDSGYTLTSPDGIRLMVANTEAAALA